MALFGRRGRAPVALPDALQPLADLGVRFRDPVDTREAAGGLPVWSVPVRGDADGLDLWSAVREHHPSTGLYPVLAASDTWEPASSGSGQVPAPAAATDADEAAAKRWLEDALARDDGRLAAAGGAPFTPVDPARWREDDPLRLDTPDRLLILPVPGGWKVPELLRWEGAPLAEVPGDGNAAFLHRWHDRYGADLVMLGSETIALRVSRPPRSFAAAVEAAREMVLYCPDTLPGLTPDDVVAMAASPTWWLLWD